jgi:hypothetical protein
VDADGVCGNLDNCPAVANADQVNADADALGDLCDACPNDAANDADADGRVRRRRQLPVRRNADQLNGTVTPRVTSATLVHRIPPTTRTPTGCAATSTTARPSPTPTSQRGRRRLG